MWIAARRSQTPTWFRSMKSLPYTARAIGKLGWTRLQITGLRASPAVAYTFSSDAKANTVHLQRTLRCDLNLLAQDKYSILRNFFQYVRTADEQHVVLLPSAAVAAN